MANSKIYLGSTNIGSMYNGASDISIYLGSEKLYPLGEPPFDGKFKAEYSDGRSYSAACDGNTGLTSGETRPDGYQYTAMTSAEIGCARRIDTYAFSGCTNLSSVTISDNVTNIGVSSFYGCSGLTSINIPISVTSISTQAFRACKGLTFITIPDSVTKIEAQVFRGCNSLTSVEIGSGVTSIGDQCFYSCISLQSITVEATTPPTLGSSVFDNTNNCPIYVPSDSVSAYKSANRWNYYSSRIEPIPNS